MFRKLAASGDATRGRLLSHRLRLSAQRPRTAGRNDSAHWFEKDFTREEVRTLRVRNQRSSAARVADSQRGKRKAAPIRPTATSTPAEWEPAQIRGLCATSSRNHTHDSPDAG